MENDLEGALPCSSLAVDSVIRVGTAGAIWGFCTGSYDARKQGLSGASYASFVARSVGGFGLQCGFVGGIFTITRCGLRKYRRKDDLANGLIAGAVAGAAVAARTRSLTQVVGTACLISAFSVAADYSRTS